MDSDTGIRQALGDKYEILSVIGRGGMATVYKAIQNSLNRPVALKVIHSNLVHDKEFIDRFLREAQVCGQLNHPSIVTVYDFGSAGSVHYMSMEYLEGVTLRERVKSSGTLDESETIRYITPIAQALAYIHQKGFVHRDVKSSNIFITREGRPVLMDFGIVYSKGIESLSQYGSLLGTPEYMSPEQAEGKLKVDGRSDLYSLGVIMFECLTGRLPFKSDNHLATLHQILHQNPPEIKSINPLVPKWLSNTVAGCLVKDRSLRISDGSILADDLRNKIFSGSLRNSNIINTEEQVTRLVETRSISSENLWRRKKIENQSYNSIKNNRRLLVAVFITLFVILAMLFIQVIRP
jgi:serine/threonine protein kinase